MTNDDAQTDPEAEIARELNRLAAAHPAFRFGTQRGWDRTRLRWVAERINGLNPGLHIVITADLTELHAALAADAAQRELRREAALRALL